MILDINGVRHELEITGEESLLWVIRGHLKLTGTKYGCGVGQCGCCTVHVDGKAIRSCITPAGKAAGKKISTIESIPEDHPVRKSWLEEQTPLCGYCQSGQIMQAIAFLAQTRNPTDDEIRKAMDGNLCRCGTYPRILRAIRRASRGQHAVTP